MSDAIAPPHADAATRPLVSLVFGVYDMARELPRTLESVRLQAGVDPADLEVIVVDNGSPEPVPESLLAGFEHGRLIRVDDAPPTPVPAMNQGIAVARGDLIGCFIDGARMLSPGVVHHALVAARTAARPVIATLGFHLGSLPHQRARASGYDQSVEDALLERIDWRSNGYRLFEESVLAGSSARGWFGPMGESNGLFLPRPLWTELGGLDERFDLPGGGLANHDLYRRACSLPDSTLVVLFGEGTFHQIHGGATTDGPRDPAPWDQYEALRGHAYSPPDRRALLVGRYRVEMRDHLRYSVDHRFGGEPAADD